MCVCVYSAHLTCHLSLDKLDEGLCEGLNPFVHDVVTSLSRVFVVQEANLLLLTQTGTHENTSKIRINSTFSHWVSNEWSDGIINVLKLNLNKKKIVGEVAV